MVHVPNHLPGWTRPFKGFRFRVAGLGVHETNSWLVGLLVLVHFYGKYMILGTWTFMVTP